MDHTPSLDPAWSNYLVAFRRDAHQLLVWGYEDARPLIKPDHEEEEITGFIAEAIDRRLDDPATPDYWDRYDIREEPRVRNSGKTGKRRKRLDIIVRSSAMKPRPEFMFEAKRLKK